MAYVWVGIDEWVMVEKSSGTGLVTAGLSGCVAVMLMTENRCLLAHVFSECELRTWKRYKPYLIAMLQAVRNGGEGIQEAALVYSDDHDNELVTLLRGLLFWEFARHPTLKHDAGCVITTSAPRQVRGVSEIGKPCMVTRPAEGKFLSIKAVPDATGSAIKSHSAHGMILGGGRLDAKPWPYVLSAEDEMD